MMVPIGCGSAMTSSIQNKFWSGGRDSSSCTFVLECPSGCTVLLCDAEAMTSTGSYDTEICLLLKPVFRCWNVDVCERLVFIRCGQMKLCSCRC